MRGRITMGFSDARKGSTLCRVQVTATQRVSPNLIRVTVGGESLAAMPQHGYDHWFRLFLPQEDGTTSWDLPGRLGAAGYAKYLRIPAAVRPVLRNYTVRDFRPEARELDVDFVVHGDEGHASRWAQRTQAGDTVVLLDQGRGYEFAADTTFHLLVGDETAMPAVVGILRDLPRDARGLAIIEVPSADDAQPVAAPPGFEVRWLDRGDAREVPGRLALAELLAWRPADPATLTAYVCGEHELPTRGRRHLVAAGVPKSRISFVGYWRADPAKYQGAEGQTAAEVAEVALERACASR
jgi:NADPH-dependent ferric siderophore reductase